ncbi:MAG: glycosyltransferase family 39 protein [bacterium]|nr:glycosyltransferase family 39 protein [bacterium]
MTVEPVKKNTVEFVFKIIGSLLIALLLFGNLVILSYGTDSLNLIRIFSNDEATGVRMVRGNLDNNDLNPGKFFNYGYLYQTTAFYLIKTLGNFGYKIDARLIALVLRLISLLSYALSGFLIYKIYTQNFDGSKELGLVTALFLMSIPSFFYWSRMVHPDTLQVLLLLIAARIAFTKHNAAGVLYASAAAGAAFGTKYSGIFIMPLLFMPYLFNTITDFKKKSRQPHQLNVKEPASSTTAPKKKAFFVHGFQVLLQNKKTVLKTITVLLIAILVFLAVWLITNPYVIKNFKEFIKDFKFEKAHVARGHGKASSTNIFLWLPLLWKQLGTISGIAVILGLLAILATAIIAIKGQGPRKYLENPVNRNIVAALIYSATTYLYLMLQVNMRQPRYLFHILPFVILVAVCGIQKITHLFKKNIPKRTVQLTLLIAVSLLTWNTLKGPAKATKKYDHEFLKAGNQIALNAPQTAVILAHTYSYVPPEFKNVTYRYEIDFDAIKEFKPEILILNRPVSQRWVWKKRNTTFKERKFKSGTFDNWKHYYAFYEKLFSPQSPWKIIYETRNIVFLKLSKNEKQ